MRRSITAQSMGLSSIANAEMKVRLKQGHNTTDFIDGPVLAHLRTVPNPENPPSEHYGVEPCDNQRGP